MQTPFLSVRVNNKPLSFYSSHLFVIEEVPQNKLQSAELNQHFGNFYNHTV